MPGRRDVDREAVAVPRPPAAVCGRDLAIPRRLRGGERGERVLHAGLADVDLPAPGGVDDDERVRAPLAVDVPHERVADPERADVGVALVREHRIRRQHRDDLVADRIDHDVGAGVVAIAVGVLGDRHRQLVVGRERADEEQQRQHGDRTRRSARLILAAARRRLGAGALAGRRSHALDAGHRQDGVVNRVVVVAERIGERRRVIAGEPEHVERRHDLVGDVRR